MAQTAPATALASPAATSALTIIAGRLKDYVGNIVKQATSRLRKNANYFRVNYLIVVLLTTAVTFLMHPSSLLVLGALLASWIYVFLLRTAPLTIGGRTLSDREKLIGMSAITFIMIFFVTSVGTVFFSALSLSLAVVALHGAFREPDNLFIDEGETQQGFLSMFTVPTAPTGTTTV
ncbi:hypothetical protein GPECTOR_6g531 [Gonium pectorale]|uniref:PRA1 family protein n=1 Tax=Gonium pectorale TaxID=33097 RepID=A0A150GUZ3_GONPE|nr:hypothetical protein GPECTOR_6g531 [Gonium pectorale]|eukprot:KXZ53614.1 hypothetical protein GPECTOR_6g531 [Gonium pectorale]